MRVKAMEWAGAGISAVVTTLVLAAGSPAWAIQCEKLQTADKDLEVQVSAVIAKIGPIKGAEADAKVKSAARQVLEKLPNADRLILHHLMYFTYCTTLRDDSTISETERSKRINEYNRVLMKALQPSSPPQRPDTGANRPESLPERSGTAQSAPGPSTTINAPHGIGISGGTVTNPTINNYAVPPARRLSAEQRSVLIAKLRSGDKPRVSILILNGNAEVMTFKNDFVELFKELDWQIKADVIGLEPSSATGIGVLVRSQSEHPAGAAAFIVTLREMGYTVEAVADERLQADEIKLVVSSAR